MLEIDGTLTALPVLDVETEREFYDYTAKHDRAQRTEHCPSMLPSEITGRLKQYALRAAGAAAASHPQGLAGT
ncbi:hypothetical protein [Streptomyces sp. NPDC048825]|uniref:hypothetical protein n=1 Tax=Streptomyces sp. NPDC048825 TaxID=3365592 RepID=UPI0037159265